MEQFTTSFDAYNLVVIVDANTGKERLRIEEQMKDTIGDIMAALAFSPDGATLASRSFRSTSVTLWDTRTGKRLRDLGKRAVIEFWAGGITKLANTVSFSPDGKSLAVSAGNKDFCVWNLTDGKAFPASPTRPRFAAGLKFSPDGNLLAWLEDGTIQLCDKTWTPIPLKQISQQLEFSSDLAFSPDSTVLAAVGRDGLLHCWDVATGRHKVELRVLPDLVAWYGRGCLAFAPNGKAIAAAFGPTIHLWDANAGNQRIPNVGHVLEVLNAELSPDGKTLISSGLDESVYLWDGVTGKLRDCLTHPLSPGLCGLHIAPNSKAFLLADEDGHLCLYDLATGATLRVLVPPAIQPDPIAGLVAQLSPGFLLAPLAATAAMTARSCWSLKEPQRYSDSRPMATAW